jgi:hypothetical protein
VVYFYAVMGVVMMTGIMAIFEMGLSLTGQSLLPAPLSGYSANTQNKAKDARLLQKLYEEDFNESALASGLCSALKEVDGEPWIMIENLQPDDYFFGSCELNRDGLCRSIVRKNNDDDMPYQLFSCALAVGKSKCSFEGM